MSVYRLDERIIFPDPLLADDDDGLVAIGGDLSEERLIAAYTAGIFPWFIENGLPFWFSPDPRCVLFPERLHISHSMKQLFKKKYFAVTIDRDFPAIIKQCAKTRRKDEANGSWIDDDFEEAYTQLHRSGLAHSVEVWKDDKLVGGLYGVSLGKCFFGESMFSNESNASKYAFIHLVAKLIKQEFTLIDCQVYNPHLESLGAEEINRVIFLRKLKRALKAPTLTGDWGILMPD